MKLTRRGLLAATILAPIVPWPKKKPTLFGMPIVKDKSLDRFASSITMAPETDFVRLPEANHWWSLVNEGGGWQLRPWEPDRSRPASHEGAE